MSKRLFLCLCVCMSAPLFASCGGGDDSCDCEAARACTGHMDDCKVSCSYSEYKACRGECDCLTKKNCSAEDLFQLCIPCQVGNTGYDSDKFCLESDISKCTSFVPERSIAIIFGMIPRTVNAGVLKVVEK